MDILRETLTPVERAALAEFVRRVRARFGDRVERMTVFGSRARGDVHEDSDIDVLVVLSGDVGWPDRRDVNHIAWAVALEAVDAGRVDLSPKTLSAREFSRLLDDEWRIALDVEREGVPL